MVCWDSLTLIPPPSPTSLIAGLLSIATITDVHICPCIPSVTFSLDALPLDLVVLQAVAGRRHLVIITPCRPCRAYGRQRFSSCNSSCTTTTIISSISRAQQSLFLSRTSACALTPRKDNTMLFCRCELCSVYF